MNQLLGARGFLMQVPGVRHRLVIETPQGFTGWLHKSRSTNCATKGESNGWGRNGNVIPYGLAGGSGANFGSYWLHSHRRNK